MRVKIGWGSNSQFYWKNESGRFYLEACGCGRSLNQPAIPDRENLFGWMLKGSDEGVNRTRSMRQSDPVNERKGDVSTVETLVEHERCRGLLSNRPESDS